MEPTQADIESASAGSSKHQAVSRVSEPRSSHDTQLQGFASSLKLLIQKHLQADSSGPSQSTTRVMKSLLDAIHVLQSQVDILGKNLKEDIAQPVSKPQKSQKSQYLVLHRVFCDKSDHCHNKAVYEDQPKYDVDSGWGFNEVLKGNIPIFNVGTYLSQRPMIHFVVFKEHACVIDKFKVKQRETPDADSISERAERLWIVSQPLRNIIKKIAQFEPYKKAPLLLNIEEMDAPYNFFFHHYQRLTKLAKTERDISDHLYWEGLDPLLSFLHQNYGVEYADAEDVLSRGLVSAAHLDKLFHPSQIVLARHLKPSDVRAGILYDCTSTNTGAVFLRGWCWGYDGKQLRRVAWSVMVDGVEGLIPITDLTIYPFDFAPAATKRALETRGERFWSIRHGKYALYNGWDTQGARYESRKVMVDIATYHHTDIYPLKNEFDTEELFKSTAVELDKELSAYDKWPLSIDNTQVSIEWEMALILPPTTMAFDMQQKFWVRLSVDSLSDMTWSRDVFDRLVLDRQNKDILLSLIGSHKATTADPVSGKGSGLTILFHGPQGVGKTLTAECIAEYAEKPLYSVNCGDIGSEPADVEKYLETVFHLAQTWDCVLLFEEADGFLEDRIYGDLKKAALASIFLRTMGYFSGILVLTTNRVATFDQAFQSHIQFSLRFGSLTKESRKEIWRHFLRDAMSKRDLRRYLDDLSAKDINGRQIKNLVGTATALAKHREEQMEIEHIRIAMAAFDSFPNHLTATSEKKNYASVLGETIAMSKMRRFDENARI